MAKLNLEFAFRSGVHAPRGSNPQVIGEYLDHLRVAAGGALTPELVVRDARDKTSPLHAWFEWSDKLAAQQRRRDQARRLIGAIVVTYRETPGAGPRTTRAFISLRPERGPRHYASAVEIMSDEQRRGRALRQAWNELQAFRKRYEALHEFAQLFAAVDELERALPPVLVETVAA